MHALLQAAGVKIRLGPATAQAMADESATASATRLQR